MGNEVILTMLGIIPNIPKDIRDCIEALRWLAQNEDDEASKKILLNDARDLQDILSYNTRRRY